MSNPTPRTRRQLREALERAEKQYALLERDFERSKEYGENLSTSLDSAIDHLYADGYSVIHAGLGRAEACAPPQRRIYTQADFDERQSVTVAQTRRETLEKVIDALEIKGYKTISYNLALISDGNIEDLMKPGPDRFWDDINTALEVREADKHAETQRKIAEKVAGLAKRDSGFSLRFIPATGFDPENPKMSDLQGGVSIQSGAIKVEKSAKKKGGKK